MRKLAFIAQAKRRRRRAPLLCGALCGALWWLAGPQLFAQPVRVSIDVDRHIARVGEEVQVTVQIMVQGNEGYDRYIPPSFADFQVQGGGMTSQNIEMFNWRVRRRESHVYTVVPLKEGTLSVGPAAVQLGRQVVRSPVIKLRVLAGGAPAPPAPQPEPDPTVSPPDETPDDVFLSAVAAPRKVYLGQQVVCTWQLFTQSDVLGFQATQQPATDGFWSEDLSSPQRLEFERRQVRDRVYYAALLARKALFPQKTGLLTITPMGAQVRTLQQFSSAAVLRQSEKLTIEVMPLPRPGQPPGFPSGNVGRYEMAASLDRSTVGGGDAVTLKVVVNGTGNIRQLQMPKLDRIDGFKVYEPKISERMDTKSRISGEKIAEYLLMPVRTGRLQVPPIKLDTFDPESGTYRRLRSDPLSLTVTGRIPSGPVAKGEAAKNVIGPTIRPPRPARSLGRFRAASLLEGKLFWVLMVLPVALVALVAGGDRLRARLARETPRRQQRQALRRVRGHLQRAKELMRQGDKSAFFGEIAAALRNLLDHKLGVMVEGLTREELRSHLLESGFGEDRVLALTQELDNCDFARFAPAASGTEQMSETLARARKLVDRLSRVSPASGKGGR